MPATLAELRTRVKQRFDLGQSAYMSDDELNGLINEAGAHLHNWIIASNEDYIVKSISIALATNQRDYPLPLDFYKCLQMWVVTTTPGSLPVYRALPRKMRREYRGGPSTFWRGPSPMWVGAYEILGATGSNPGVIRVDPTPTQPPNNVMLELMYTPNYVPLVLDGDTMAAAVAPGWDEFVVNQAVINARLKEESDVTPLLNAQAIVKQMIEQDMINRDMGQPQHVVDTDPSSGFGFAWGGRGFYGWY